MKNMEKKPFWYVFFRTLCLIVLRYKCRFKTSGAKNVPAHGGCIIASNHVSVLDPPVVGCGPLHRHVRFMARETLFNNSLAKWWSRAVGVIPLDRTKGDIGAMRTALRILRAGGALALFPEGTRSPDGQLQQGKGGVGFLIAKAGVPVVPAYISGTYEALPKGARTIRRHPVSVVYGPPIMPDEFKLMLDRPDNYKAIADLVMTRIAECRDQIAKPGSKET